MLDQRQDDGEQDALLDAHDYDRHHGGERDPEFRWSSFMNVAQAAKVDQLDAYQEHHGRQHRLRHEGEGLGEEQQNDQHDQGGEQQR